MGPKDTNRRRGLAPCALALAVLSGQSALAESGDAQACLDAAALDAGVLVTFVDGSWTHVSRREGDLLQLNHQPKSASGQLRPVGRDIRHAHYGVYPTLIDVVDPIYSVQITRAFAQEPPRPFAAMDVTLPLTQVSGIKQSDIGLRFVAGDSQDLQVIGCNYTAITVREIALAKKSAAAAEVQMLYFPELGFGLPLYGAIADIGAAP